MANIVDKIMRLCYLVFSLSSLWRKKYERAKRTP
jgi:hypothetical protein